VPLHEIVHVASQSDKQIDEDEDEGPYVFKVEVVEDGHNAGRPVLLKAASREEFNQWVDTIRRCAREALDRIEAEHDVGPLAKERRGARQFYQLQSVQSAFGAVIMLAFLIAMIEAECGLTCTPETVVVLKVFEIVFTTIFTIELGINMFGNWFWHFLNDPWNLFDLFVVIISIVGLSSENFPGLGSLRLLRVFKLVRLVKQHCPALHVLLLALATSTVPVLYSFVILLVVQSIYAIICTQFFADEHDEFFGTFSRSIFSLFQMATGDSWSSVIVRTLMAGQSVSLWRLI
jgi:voltage-gated sodium channel